MTHDLTFLDNGTVRGLTTDRIPLGELGVRCVRRRSWVDFNENAQEWEVRLTPHADDPVFTSPDREACLAWERNHFQSLPISAL